MLISQVVKECDITQDTLRYYEKEGLIGPIKKGQNGMRNYCEEDLKRISFVKCMRDAGVEIKALKEYMRLIDAKDNTVEKRRDILVKQRKIIQKKIDAMQAAYDKLNYKIKLYDDKLLDKNI